MTLRTNLNLGYIFGRGGGLVVSVPAFYSHDPSSNPAGFLINFLSFTSNQLSSRVLSGFKYLTSLGNFLPSVQQAATHLHCR